MKRTAARWLILLLLGPGCSPSPPAPSPPQAEEPTPAVPTPVAAPADPDFPWSLEGLPLPRPLAPEEYADLPPEDAAYAEQQLHMLSTERDEAFLPLEVIRRMGLREGHAVADVGAGSGYFTYRFSRVVGPTGKVYAVDVMPEPLLYMETILKREAEPVYANITTVQSLNDDVKLEPASVDFAFLCVMHYLNYSYMHEPPPEAAQDIAADPVGFMAREAAPFLASIQEAVRPGGKLVVIEGRIEHNPQSDLDEEGIVEVVERNGFQLEASHDLLKNDYFLVFGKVEAP